MASATNALFSLEGQTALVTGGTRGIGQAIAIALAEAGADLLLIQRDTTNLTTLKAVEALGRKATIYVADLASPSDVEELVPTILCDGHQIRILVNCAGIQRRHPSEKFPDTDFNEVIQVNLNTPFALCRDVAAHMLELPEHATTGRKGSIINFGSLLSFQGGITVPAYAASKGGVAQMTKTFSNEWTSRGITVNCVAPGYIATDMNEALLNNPERLRSISERIPAGRWGTPEDFKGPIVFLASKAGAYVSGHTMVVDGGWMGR
ncbi:2-dehydro-3-deoxy-D-gluconate 5-dehydrogenase [Cytospora mali]|uniref:2-dehydro-3-deoxy-D-gluconate 5-dehydrogenase n=1 Tax=Cytospora mali TaxID=578113 RepID=A0A194VJK4_CYTMA|nr:2-dehydro-3-deoxy-D-gluconate 5-dehydrogenase [Valsa mali]